VSAAEARAAKKDASRLERRMLKLDADEKKLHQQLAAAAADYARAAALVAELKALHAEKEQVENDWLAATEIAEG
jgi:ATP-binding cassette subfamily F protein uup